MAYEPVIVAKKASVKDRVVHLRLADGSTHSFPVAYYPRLASASDAALKKIRLRLGGKALRWEDLDEDIWIGHAVMGRYPASSKELITA
ncbi:MAG: DUF2442 domain-containing protein [Methylacidiphilales bacterium]|nr:DUF2442 domain-containing protein [Candidatus Methylacidiphilales bacterium]